MGMCIARNLLAFLLGFCRLPVAVSAGCTPTGSNCNETRCCSEEGMRCFEKNQGWSTCKYWCDPGVDNNEPLQFRTPWSCAVVGVPAGSSTMFGCSAAGKDCRGTGCCKQEGHTCFQRNADWATCQQECKSGVNLWEPEESRVPWTCAVVGIPALGYLDLFNGRDLLSGGGPKCADPGGDCRQSGCCSRSGFQCYQKDKNWATCRKSCAAGVDIMEDEEFQTPWSCAPLIRATGSNLHCSAFNDNCKSTGCCLNEGMNCFEKDSHFATCKTGCTPGVDSNDPLGHQTPWTCKVLTSPSAVQWSAIPQTQQIGYGQQGQYKTGTLGILPAPSPAQPLATENYPSFMADWTTTTTTAEAGWWKMKQLPSMSFGMMKKNSEEPIEYQRTHQDDIYTRSIRFSWVIPVAGMLSLFAGFAHRRYVRQGYTQASSSISDDAGEDSFADWGLNLEALVQHDGAAP